MSRRKFINTGVRGSVGLGMAPGLLSLPGCLPSRETVHGACYHDCPDTCSWQVLVENGKVVGFEGVKNHPYTQGKLCDKIKKMPWEVTYHPDRLLYPLKRVGRKGEGKFERISWEKAIDEVADNLHRIIDSHGGSAILPYWFAGTSGMVQMNCMSKRFFATLGASEMKPTICGSTAYAGVVATQGASIGMLPEDIQHSRFIIIWGSNPAITNQHLMPFIGMAQAKGARVVVIDPTRSQTAEHADQHIRPLPGTDSALALGLMHVIINDALYDQEYVDNFTVGFEPLKDHIQSYTPEHVASITGIDKEVIIQLARDYARTRPACIRALVGMEHHGNGASVFRSIACLPALTGAWKEVGGGLLHFTDDLFGAALNYYDYDIPAKHKLHPPRMINMVTLGKTLNDQNLDPPVMALFVHNSNPAVIAPNQNLVWEGLRRNDLFTVVLENFMTDTAKFADFVFPSTSHLEHWDLMKSWGQHYINLNQPAIEALGESKSNSQFFRLLANAMGRDEKYLYESDVDIIKTLLNTEHEYMKGITFNKLSRDGWAPLNLPQPFLPYAEGNFRTPSGKCEFYSESMKKQGKNPLPDYSPVSYSDEEIRLYPLLMMTTKHVNKFLNTSHANVHHQQVKKREFVLHMHPADAMVRDLKDGSMVRVYNQRGSMLINLRISEKTQPGLVTLPHGFWPSLVEGGSSANALTPDGLSDMGGGADFHDARVEVEVHIA